MEFDTPLRALLALSASYLGLDLGTSRTGGLARRAVAQAPAGGQRRASHATFERMPAHDGAEKCCA